MKKIGMSSSGAIKSRIKVRISMKSVSGSSSGRGYL